MPSRAIIPEDPGYHDEGHRVVKLSCSKLTRGNATLIRVLEDMSIKNAQLAVRGSIILNNMIIMCVSENIPVPEDFMDQTFLARALNWNFASKLHRLRNETLADAVAGTFSYDNMDSRTVDPSTRFVIPNEDLLGHAWLIDNLVTEFKTNIHVAIKAKWRAFINDSISTFKQVNELPKYSNVLKEIKRLIYNPVGPPQSGAPHPLTLESWNLIEFHRRGFGVLDTNAPLNDAYFSNSDLYHHHVYHFGKCLERQCEAEQQHDQQFTKCLPLPMCEMGKRRSIHIDKKGLYWIICELKKRYQAAGHFPPHLSTQRFNKMVKAQAKFDENMYWDWIHRLFRINNVITHNKVFSKNGIGLTTDGVSVSVHYKKYIEQNPNAKTKAIRSVRARINSVRRAKRRVTPIVKQSIKTKDEKTTNEMDMDGKQSEFVCVLRIVYTQIRTSACFQQIFPHCFCIVIRGAQTSCTCMYVMVMACYSRSWSLLAGVTMLEQRLMQLSKDQINGTAVAS